MNNDRLELDVGANGYQLSNPSVLTTVSLLGSLEMFELAGGMSSLRQKSLLLTGYLEALIRLSDLNALVKIITPSDPNQRGCQLSIHTPRLKEIQQQLQKNGVICDFRYPDVVRLAPVPLYTRFSDVRKFFDIIKQVLSS